MFFTAKYINCHKLSLKYFKAVAKKIYNNSCKILQLFCLFAIARVVANFLIFA